MERGGDEGRRATAHNASSVAGGGPAMMWHCSDPPHVFFGPLCLLLHPSHAAPPWDGPSPSPHPPPPPPPTARPPMSPGTEQALAVFPTWPCHITHKGAFQSAIRGTSGLRFPRLPAHKNVLWPRRDTRCYTQVSQCRSLLRSLLSAHTPSLSAGVARSVIERHKGERSPLLS